MLCLCSSILSLMTFQAMRCSLDVRLRVPVDNTRPSIGPSCTRISLHSHIPIHCFLSQWGFICRVSGTVASFFSMSHLKGHYRLNKFLF